MRYLLAVSLALLPAGASAGPKAEDGDLAVELVTKDVIAPVAMAFIGPDDFLVLEKNDGRVQRFASGARTQVLDLAVNRAGERGLLGIAVHPDFAAAVDPKPWVYLYYTPSGSAGDIDDSGATGTNQVDRFTWNGIALVGRTPILTLPGDDSNHNGGTLAFGPDEKLYGVNGDNNRNGQLQNNPAGAAPDGTGLIFRINDDGTIPTDNPLDADMDGIDAEDKIYAYGIRNSFGLAFDPASGKLWDSENGPQAFDEINRVDPGFNSGWRRKMGPATPNPPSGLAELPGSAYADPAYSIQDPVAVTGVAFTTPNSSLGSEYVEDLFVADFLHGQIYRFELNAMRDGLAVGHLVANSQKELEQHLFAGGFEGISDLKEGPDGALYVVAYRLDAIYRIEGDGGPTLHDLAVASVKAPRKVSLEGATPTTGSLGVTLVNAGTVTETVSDLAELEDLVAVSGAALTGSCPAAPTPMLVPPKKGFPVTLPPGKKLKLTYTLEFDCAAVDPLAVEFEWDVSVDLTALGSTDADAANDVCPRAAAGDDKGCGGKPAGSPIRTDVILK